jgi:hypothetical protein
MRSLLLLSLFATGCAHLNQAPAPVSVFATMSDAQVARLAVQEALGELHQVAAVDADGFAQGHAAFASRDDRLAFEGRIDSLLRERIYGQGPTLNLVRLACEGQQQAGWADWPADRAANRRACDFGDDLVTVHSLFKKPMLQRAFVDVLLRVVADPAFATHARERLTSLQSVGVEPYTLVVEAWDRIEGFRPRG